MIILIMRLVLIAILMIVTIITMSIHINSLGGTLPAGTVGVEL